LVLEGIAGLESFLIALSSMIGNGLLDDVNWGFLLFTVILFEFSFLIIDCCCCFFFGFITDCSTLTFLLIAGFTVGMGENGRFCGGEWWIGCSGGGGGGGGAIGSSSASLSSVSLFPVSFIFYIQTK
jgi:hypothetical protein